MRGETTTDDPERGCASGVQPTKVVITPLLIELHWPPVAARIKFKSLMLLAYRVIADSAPTYLNALVRANVTPRGVPLYLQEAFEEPTLQRAPPFLTGT